MKHSKKKKGLLSVAFSLIPIAVTMLVEGQTVEGGILVAIAAGLVILYDYYDDKAKAVPAFIQNIDQEVYEQIASIGADKVNEAIDQYEHNK